MTLTLFNINLAAQDLAAWPVRTTLPKRQALQQLDGSVQIKFAK